MNRTWKMVLEEPYRVFFPLGVIAGIWGVMMWPILYAGWLSFYPGEAHTRLMVEGFMGAFALGFIGTAFPRLTGNHCWFAGEFLALLVLWLLTVFSHAAGHVAAGDSAFSVLLLSLFAGMAGRWIFGSKDTPPPGFILALAGILGAAASVHFLSKGPGSSMELYQFARLWLFQGFMLLPLMGIGPYLLPRFFGAASSHSFPESRTPPPGWWPRALAATIAGLLICTSFALEVYGNALAGQLLRAAVILGWFAFETPVFRKAKTKSTPGNAVRIAIVSLAAGCICAAFWPHTRVGSLHLFFASGLGLVTLAAGTRVILGHAGYHDLLVGKIVWLRWTIGLLILAALTRMTSDFLPAVRMTHIIYAAWSWAAGGIIWLAALSKYLLRDESTKKKSSGCPRRKNRPQS